MNIAHDNGGYQSLALAVIGQHAATLRHSTLVLVSTKAGFTFTIVVLPCG
jgi:hypothetical protein